MATVIEGGSLVQNAVHAVRAHIRDNDLKAGDTLPGESHFASMLGVSRAVMREAFGALAALRQIDVANGRRARVAAIDGSVMAASLDHAVSTSQISFAEVWDVRRTVELRIAELAAIRRTPAQAREIVSLAEAMAQAADDLPRLTAIDIKLHQAIAEASGNALFSQMVRSYAALMQFAVPQAWDMRTSDEDRSSTLERHRIMAQTIADGDPVAAVAAMEAHFEASITGMIQPDYSL